MFNNCVYPWWLSNKESTCNAGDAGSIPGLGRSSVIGNGNPLQYSCLGNLMNKVQRVTVHSPQSMGLQRVRDMM